MQITEANAIAYVVDYFAKTEWDSETVKPECEILFAQPSPDIDDGDNADNAAIDVHFRLSDSPEYVNRFTVWIERHRNAAPFIYGEW